MDAATAAALNRINLRFYSQQARAFSRTRNRPWPGWQRVIAAFEQRSLPVAAVHTVPSILDLGCGNARFAQFLASRLTDSCRYLAMDASADMLAEAQRGLADLKAINWSLARFDLLEGELWPLSAARFDLIVVFGLLHHLPGIARRRSLLRTLSRSLRDGGLLALAFWQFALDERLKERIISWEVYNRQTDEKIDVGQLESGDHLLIWGEPQRAELRDDLAHQPKRYCHFCSQVEAEALVETLGLSVVDRYHADGRSGRLNLYYILGDCG